MSRYVHEDGLSSPQRSEHI
ncbi:hypothetical protein FG05_35242 [Fusarium graminearum]|nr:hypothetical protein FG05_35242 [Fusarium graminearum]